MKNLIVCAVLLCLLLTGCTVRTYTVVKDRVDQEVTGNQGYIMGGTPTSYQQPKKFEKRTTRIVEVEMRPPVKFEELKEEPTTKPKVKPADITFEEPITPIESQGENARLKILPIEVPATTPAAKEAAAATGVTYDTYIVKKDDTLQKISTELFGTTKKWMKIYEANKDALSSPDKIYPGQKIRIPKE